jgi:LPXTG-motif cell wall-anchored protein
MTKNSKLVLALILAAMMIVSMIPAMAAQEQAALSISNPMDGHTYTAYQLFVGDLSGTTLSNVKWGSNAKIEAITFTPVGKSETKTITPAVGSLVDEEFLEYCESLTSNTKATADFFGDLVTGTGTVITATAQNVDTGYYVIKDAYAVASAAQTSTLSTYVCKVVGPTAIENKAGTTTHKKEVADVNDTSDTALDTSNLIGIDASKWSTSADHDFGDHVPFKLTTTIASDFAKYDSYYLAVNDTLKDGLILDQDSIKVYVDGVLATEGNEDGQYSLTKADKSFKVEFTKLNGNAKAAAGKDVVIVYTATLDSATAVIGNPGNWNESYAEFSNNPNDTQTGKGQTPKATAVVFTYKTVVNKVDEDETTPLKGAEFTLTKALQAGGTQTIAVIKYDKDGNATTKTADGTATSEGDATQFSFNGLDDGTYTLTETVTPAGYNTIAPVVFKVEATHTAEGTTLAIKNADGSAFSGTLTFTKISDEQGYSTDVVNKKGATLPSTGGVGTTIFYVAGSILVLAAAILLITKRRMGAND